MGIKIQTTKKMINGEPFRIIDSIEALKNHQLPREYLEGAPRAVSRWDEYLEVVDEQENCLNIGGKIREEDFQEAVEIARRAGRRLREIKKRNQERYPEHCYTKETIMI